MISEFRNNFLASFLIGLIVFSPFFANVKTANAQAASGSLNAGTSGWANVGGIAAVAINCAIGTGLLGDAAESVGSAIGGIFGSSSAGSEAGSALADIAAGDAAGAAASGVAAGAAAAASATQVPVTDPQTHKNIEDTTEKVNINNKKEYCLDKIAKEAVTRVIDKMTLATVDWINNGFEGDPFFVSDPEAFFTNVAVGEINGFIRFFTSICSANAEFGTDGTSSSSSDPECDPSDFGQAVAEAILQNLQRSTYQRFQNSLGMVLAHGTPEEFHVDFNVGGWAGYTALFEPQNNPYGSYLLASDEIGKRIEGYHLNKVQNFNKQLNLSGGFFDQQVCSLTGTGDPEDEYIDKEDPRHSPPGTTPSIDLLVYLGIDPYMVGPLSPEQQELVDHYQLMSVCEKWRTNTPGYVVANQLTDVLGSPLRQLELTDEWQENLALIMDALLNQFINGNGDASLNGLLGLNPEGQDENNNVLIGQVNGLLPGQQSNTTTITDAINGTDPDFDPGIVAIQQDYLVQAIINIQKIQELILHIRGLDYCVPGPNPNWYDFALGRLQNAITSTPPATGDLDDMQTYYAMKIAEFTGIELFPSVDIQTYTDFADFMIYAFTAYRDAMYSFYSVNNPPPTMRPTLYNLFNQISSLAEEANNYQNQVNNLTTLLPQLINIQNQINALLADANPLNDDPNSPEMQAIGDLFEDIADQGLVNGSQLDALFARMNVYEYLLGQADDSLAVCLVETEAPGYPNDQDERVAYPAEANLDTHPAFGTFPTPDTMYMSGLQFSDDAGDIDLSGFHDEDLSVPSADLDIFQNFLGVY